MKKIIILLIISGLFFSLLPINIISASGSYTVKLSPVVDTFPIGADWYQVGATNTTKYDAIDEDADLEHDGDLTYIWHDTANSLQMFGIANGNIPSSNTIDSIVLHIIAKDMGTGNNALTLRIKFIPESPDVYYKEDYALTTTYTEYTFDIKDDALGQERDWIPSDFDNQLIEVGIRATGNGNAERRITQMWLEVEHSEYNHPPNQLNESPINETTNVLISTNTLSIDILDDDGDLMSYTIQTYPNIGSSSGSEQNNGSITCNISGLNSFTTYYWYVNITDGLIWNNKTYHFTTEINNLPNKPICIYPIDKTTQININVILETRVVDIDNDNMNVSFYINDIFIEKICNVSNNTIVESSNINLDYSKIYTWHVVAEDKYFSVQSDTFIFATQSEPDLPISNNPPEKPILISPDNNSINVSIFTKLKAYVDDSDDDFIFAFFFWENNELIHSLFIPTNYNIETLNLELELDTTYAWYVIVTDFIDFNLSDIYTFKTESTNETDEELCIYPSLDFDYTVLFVGICLALFVFILEFFSNKLKIKRGKTLSIVELALIIIIIFIMIFLKFT